MISGQSPISCQGGVPCRGYELLNDINLAGLMWEPIGTHENPFTSNFRGNGFIISNISISASGKDELGLFGVTRAASLSNFGIQNCNIEGNENLGCVTGWQSYGSINNVFVVGSIKGNASVGLLLGRTDMKNHVIGFQPPAIIFDVYTIGWVSARESRGGGLIGQLAGNNPGRLNSAYSSATVLGKENIGGLVGHYQYGLFSNSYTTGFVRGEVESGGFLGLASGGIPSGTNLFVTSVSGATFPSINGGIGGGCSMEYCNVTKKTIEEIKNLDETMEPHRFWATSRAWDFTSRSISGNGVVIGRTLDGLPALKTTEGVRIRGQ